MENILSHQAILKLIQSKYRLASLCEKTGAQCVNRQTENYKLKI